MTLVSGPLKTGALPMGTPSPRGEAPSRPLPRTAAHEPRVVLRLPDCGQSTVPAAEPRAAAAVLAGWRIWTTQPSRPVLALSKFLSQPRSLLACVIALSVALAVVIFASRAGRPAKPIHDESTSAVAPNDAPTPRPHSAGVIMSTSDGPRSAPAANQPRMGRVPAMDRESPPVAAPNRAASLPPEAPLEWPGNLPRRAPSGPSASDNEQSARSPRAWIETIR